LGYEAELVAGRYAHAAHHLCGHTWVIFRDGGAVYMFDPVIRDPGAMIRPFCESCLEYLPECSIDAQFNRYVYSGYLLHLRQRKRPAKRRFQMAIHAMYTRLRRLGNPVASSVS
jgi:hypothetical protein